MSPELTITIVNWNGIGFLPACLKSIAENPPSVPFEVVVVDNASTDGSREWLQTTEASEILPEGALVVIFNEENSGFGRAHNMAIRNSSGVFVLILNPDSIILPGAIDELLRSLKSDEEIGAVAPKLFNEDGSPQASVTLFPLNPFTIIILGFGLPRFFPKTVRKKFYGDYWEHDEERPVPAFWGAAILARRTMIDRIGGFDEDFFMYGEDHEWCARINQRGWKTVFVPSAEIIHLGGRSAGQVWGSSEKELRMWTGDILAHKKSLPPIVAAANAITRAGIFLAGYLPRRVLRRETGFRRERIILQLEAARDALSNRKRSDVKK